MVFMMEHEIRYSLESRLAQATSRIIGPLHGCDGSSDALFELIDKQAVEQLLLLLDEMVIFFINEQYIAKSIASYLYNIYAQLIRCAIQVDDIELRKLADIVDIKVLIIYHFLRFEQMNIIKKQGTIGIDKLYMIYDNLSRLAGNVYGPLRGFVESPSHIYHKLDQDAVDHLLRLLHEIEYIIRDDDWLSLPIAGRLYSILSQIITESYDIPRTDPIYNPTIQLAWVVDSHLRQIFHVPESDSS